MDEAVSYRGELFHLIFNGHDQNAADFQHDLHVVLVVFLNPSSAVDAVVLMAVRRDLQTVSHDEIRLTEFKPETERLYYTHGHVTEARYHECSILIGHKAVVQFLRQRRSCKSQDCVNVGLYGAKRAKLLTCGGFQTAQK